MTNCLWTKMVVESDPERYGTVTRNTVTHYFCNYSVGIAPGALTASPEFQMSITRQWLRSFNDLAQL
jgi:hypothetical protein